MNSTLIKSIANAVLYEGYLLYPYRPSALKNRQRWNFGVLYPQSYSEMNKGTDPWLMRTECLIRGSESTCVEIKVRFLQCIARRMSKSSAASSESNADNPALESWQEAAECEETVPVLRLADLIAVPVLHGFDVPGGEELESAEDGAGTIAGPIVRTREDLSGNVEVSATKCSDGVFKLTVVLSNSTAAEAPDLLNRDDVLLKSLLSAHTILGVIGGEFISMIDPPEELRTIASNCQNVGTWPVLVGEDNSKDALLSSPIILYDYPQIAPESPGDLFDGTEIDEILALRILTLSDDEKREIRQTDDRAREILERTEAMPAEHFVKLHGVLRGIKPVAEVSEIQTPREDQR